MYEIPKDSNIGEVTITRDYIEKKGGPVITLRGNIEKKANALTKLKCCSIVIVD
jgi:ATP-dependent protease Clp ATPase subunit